MRAILRLCSYYLQYRAKLGFGIFSVILAGLFGMLSPLMVNFAVRYGLDPQYDGDKVVGIDGNMWLLVLSCGAVILFAIGRGLAGFGQQYLGQTLGQDVAYDIRNKVYDNLQSLSFAYHDKVQTGQVMSRITTDVEAIRQFPMQSIFRLFYIFVMVVVGITGMFWINWQLALVSIISLPFMGWRSYVLSKNVRPIWSQVQENIAEITRIAEEALTGIRVVKAFSREDFESDKFRVAAERSADLSYKASKVNALNQPIIIGLGSLQIAVSMAFGAYLITQGSLTAGELLTFALWLNLLQMPARQIGFSLTWMMRVISSAERIFELLDAQSAVTERPGATELPEIKGHVELKGVSFTYDNLSAVLDKVDIDATPGRVVALLGPAGSGKSTIVNLIPRFYDVTEGSILIDGHDVRDVTLASLRRAIGIVQQDVFLFIGTIRENISYGRPEATQEEIIAAAKAARIHDFIESLPNGYDEWVGERGVTLSGGQKQRVAIARTLLMDPKILILDDSTASVDMQTEYLIQQALSALMRGRTTFVIGQRLRTIMRADEIVVLDDGKVVERGTHAELITQNGLYRRIYDLELKDQEEALGNSSTPAGEVAGSATDTGGAS